MIGKKTYRFIIEVGLSDDFKDVTATIGVDGPNPPFPAIVVAAEHMMTAAAMNDGKGFEQRLKLLCDGARTNKVKMFDGKRTDQ